MKDIEMTGKSGQVRDGGKKTGGVAFCIKMDGHHVERIMERIMQDAGKVAQAMFAYGLTAGAQKELGYEIPGAVPWKEGAVAPAYEWKDVDTEDYIGALDTWDALPRNGGGLSVEARQAAWDKKAEAFKSLVPTADAGTLESILGKRPVAKAV